jgi:hypothetical protein
MGCWSKPRPTPEEETWYPLYKGLGFRWAPEPGWALREISPPTGIRSPYHPARSVVAIPTTTPRSTFFVHKVDLRAAICQRAENKNALRLFL